MRPQAAFFSPLHTGGKQESSLAEFAQTNSGERKSSAIPTLHHAMARLRPSRIMRPRLSRSFALPKPGPPRLGGRGSVRAGKGDRGSAGALPSRNLGRRTWEGEAPSEPARATEAQQELRPPETWAAAPGRARLRPSRQGRPRLSRSFALPKPGPPPGRARLRPSRQRRPRLSRSFALPKPGPPHLGGRGSVRAGKGDRGSAGASPSRNLGRRTWEGEAPSEPARATAAQQELRPPKSGAAGLGRARLRPSRQRRRRRSRSFALPKAGPPQLGGRGSVRAGKGDRGSAGASPSPTCANAVTRQVPARGQSARQVYRPQAS